MKHVIMVRETGGTYLARAQGSKVSASCTSDARWAVERVAMKLRGLPTDRKQPGYREFAACGITLERNHGALWFAEWQEQEPS
jgi:hypothetical protein